MEDQEQDRDKVKRAPAGAATAPGERQQDKDKEQAIQQPVDVTRSMLMLTNTQHTKCVPLDTAADTSLMTTLHHAITCFFVQVIAMVDTA